MYDEEGQAGCDCLCFSLLCGFVLFVTLVILISTDYHIVLVVIAIIFFIIFCCFVVLPHLVEHFYDVLEYCNMLKNWCFRTGMLTAKVVPTPWAMEVDVELGECWGIEMVNTNIAHPVDVATVIVIEN